MKSGVVLLGGVIAAGKTTLAGELVARHQFIRVSTRDFLEKRALSKGLDPTRSVLQRMGDELDEDTGGIWVLDRIEAALQAQPSARGFLLDSVRRDFQIRRARERWPEQALYVHLMIPREVARKRYDARRKESLQSDVTVSFDEAKASPTEQHAETLASFANLVLDMSALGPVEAANRLVEMFQEFLEAGQRCA